MPNESQLPAGHTAETHPAPSERGPGYEVRDTSVRAIVTFIVGLFLFLVVAQVALRGFLRSIVDNDPEQPVPPASVARDTGVGRGRTFLINDQRRALNAREDAALHGGYSWVDKKRGAVRVPIEHAIDLLTDRGLPPTGGPRRTEVDVNSHSGTAVSDSRLQDNNKDRGKDKTEAKTPPKAEVPASERAKNRGNTIGRSNSGEGSSK